jgi:DNA end-binding protein Ku
VASTVWKGYISFGLISVPIRLYSAARYSHISFHEVHRECGTRVRQQFYCPHDKRVVDRDELAKGIEVSKGKMILVEDRELKELQPPSSTVMEILQFVKLSELDPIYFETSYFSAPDEAGRRAYTLLLTTMERLNLAAIAKVTIHQRERTVVLRKYENGLMLHTIYYPDEIREVAEYGKGNAKDLKAQEVALAEQFAKGLVKPFRPSQFQDEYKARVEKLIELKRKGKSLPKPEQPRKLAPVIDLMDALKKSIDSKGKSSSSSKALKKSSSSHRKAS